MDMALRLLCFELLKVENVKKVFRIIVTMLTIFQLHAQEKKNYKL